MKQHYERATRAYDIQKYQEAVEEYQRAYEIGGDPAMLFNIAQAYRLNDQLSEAMRFYKRYLQRSPNARNRDDVERKIADLDKQIEARRQAAASVPPPVQPPPVVVTPPPVIPMPPPAPPPHKSVSVAGIVLASVGGAALVTAVITGKLASNKADSLTKASMNGGSTFDPKVESDGKRLNTIAIISAIVGAAAAAGGATLIILSRSGKADEHSAMVAPVIAEGMAGATAILHF